MIDEYNKDLHTITLNKKKKKITLMKFLCDLLGKYSAELHVGVINAFVYYDLLGKYSL